MRTNSALNFISNRGQLKLKLPNKAERKSLLNFPVNGVVNGSRNELPGIRVFVDSRPPERCPKMANGPLDPVGILRIKPPRRCWILRYYTERLLFWGVRMKTFYISNVMILLIEGLFFFLSTHHPIIIQAELYDQTLAPALPAKCTIFCPKEYQITMDLNSMHSSILKQMKKPNEYLDLQSGSIDRISNNIHCYYINSYHPMIFMKYKNDPVRSTKESPASKGSKRLFLRDARRYDKSA